ncbi:hypothetical protein [Flavobacterium sp.]|jgi:hypothetical protein|uniref:hypothetical protein n=1 Tax=Flavobacterium sp. TaxID=239 RepID=UPI0038FCE614
MKKIIILTAFVISSLFTACQSNTYEEITVVTNPTYTKNIEPIFKSQCTGCHATGTRFPNLDNYADVKLNCDSGDVICRIDDPTVCFGGIMPTSGRMPQTTIDMIKLWKSQGFVN